MHLFRKDKSIDVSLPEAQIVHGVEIRKVPTAAYITALKKAENLPSLICDACFPGVSVDEIVRQLLGADKNTILALLGRLLTTAPELIVAMHCEVMGLDKESTLNTYTPKELLDIFTAFWEANDLSDFFVRAWGLIKAKLPAQTIGSRSGSPSVRA